MLLLVLGFLWLAGDTGLLAIDIPWLPVIVIIIAIGWIVNHYTHQEGDGDDRHRS